MTAAQLGFAASHYVGSQKLFLPETQALRALNPDFIMDSCSTTTSASGRRPTTTRS
jgi:hypothetical protein